MPQQPPRFGKQSTQRKPWQLAEGVTDRRVRGRAGQRLRMRILRAEPLCRICAEAGMIVASAEVDHRIPLSEGGSSERSNLQGLCKACHDAKSKAERAEARRP